jgi:hypothetical protein
MNESVVVGEHASPGAWCGGLVLVFRCGATGFLFCACDKCDTCWRRPEDILLGKGEPMQAVCGGAAEAATYEQVRLGGWDRKVVQLSLEYPVLETAGQTVHPPPGLQGLPAACDAEFRRILRFRERPAADVLCPRCGKPARWSGTGVKHEWPASGATRCSASLGILCPACRLRVSAAGLLPLPKWLEATETQRMGPDDRS